VSERSQYISNLKYDGRAGQERVVNISKGGFMFAPSAQLPKLLNEFDVKYLARYTPCSGMDEEQLITAIAITHVELILIHPFRERKQAPVATVSQRDGRSGRIQTAGLSNLGQNKTRYISAIHAGMSMGYEPMKLCVSEALKRN
jgi:cell filamentation protein